MDPTNTLLIPESEIEFGNRDIPFNISGGFGDIFVGFHQKFGEVAVKRLRSSSDSDPTEEAKSIRVSSLPNSCVQNSVLTFVLP